MSSFSALGCSSSPASVADVLFRLPQIAATFTNPFDVVKTRRQALDTNAISAEALAKGEVPPPQLTKTFAIAKDIFQKEGMAGLMRGLTPRLAKVSHSSHLWRRREERGAVNRSLTLFSISSLLPCSITRRSGPPVDS